MSAIGSYAVLSRSKFPLCLEKAQAVRHETTGWWIFETTRVVGVEDFNQAWSDALVEEVAFDYSGYVLGDYLTAQEDINHIVLFDEQSETGRALSKVFTAGFLFDTPLSPLPLPPDRLLAYSRDEWGADEAPAGVEAVQAADAFYRRGLAAITPEHLVVFIIR
jgi:hypothetical protein